MRSRGSTFWAAALWAQSCCLICSALRFSAASRYSGATAFGSTSFWATLCVAKIGPAANAKQNKKDLKLSSTGWRLV